MKKLALYEIKHAFKSKEYWFAFILIIISSIGSLKINLDRYDSINESIGMAEFFIASILSGNNLLQITAPIIPIFITLHSSGVFCNSYQKDLSIKKEFMSRIFSTVIIAISIFVISYLVIFMVGIILFGISTGLYEGLIGPFSTLYKDLPFLYLMACTIYACFFSLSYALLGMGIGQNLNKCKTLCLYIPLIFYTDFNRILMLLPDKLNVTLNWILPLYTFDMALMNYSLLRRIVEIGFVLIVGLLLIFVAFIRKNKKLKKKKNS